MQPNNPYFFNYPNYMTPQANRLNQLEQQYPQFANNSYSMYNNMQPFNNPVNNQSNLYLQGKTIDNYDVVKVMDAPMDGTIAYFPKADRSVIYTKQLQNDGTSRTEAYKLVSNCTNKSIEDINTPDKTNNSISQTDINKEISVLKQTIDNLSINLSSQLEEIKNSIYKDDIDKGSKQTNKNSLGKVGNK